MSKSKSPAPRPSSSDGTQIAEKEPVSAGPAAQATPVVTPEAKIPSDTSGGEQALVQPSAPSEPAQELVLPPFSPPQHQHHHHHHKHPHSQDDQSQTSSDPPKRKLPRVKLKLGKNPSLTIIPPDPAEDAEAQPLHTPEEQSLPPSVSRKDRKARSSSAAGKRTASSSAPSQVVTPVSPVAKKRKARSDSVASPSKAKHTKKKRKSAVGTTSDGSLEGVVQHVHNLHVEDSEGRSAIGASAQTPVTPLAAEGKAGEDQMDVDDASDSPIPSAATLVAFPSDPLSSKEKAKLQDLDITANTLSTQSPQAVVAAGHAYTLEAFERGDFVYPRSGTLEEGELKESPAGRSRKTRSPAVLGDLTPIASMKSLGDGVTVQSAAVGDALPSDQSPSTITAQANGDPSAFLISTGGAAPRATVVKPYFGDTDVVLGFARGDDRWQPAKIDFEISDEQMQMVKQWVGGFSALK